METGLMASEEEPRSQDPKLVTLQTIEEQAEQEVALGDTDLNIQLTLDDIKYIPVQLLNKIKLSDLGDLSELHHISQEMVGEIHFK